MCTKNLRRKLNDYNITLIFIIRIKFMSSGPEANAEITITTITQAAAATTAVVTSSRRKCNRESIIR